MILGAEEEEEEAFTQTFILIFHYEKSVFTLTTFFVRLMNKVGRYQLIPLGK